MAEQNMAKIPVEIRVIYDSKSYRCEFREGGRLFKATSGDFLEGENDLAGRVEKLTEAISTGLSHLVALGSGNIADYVVHSSIQPVPDVYADNVAVHPEDVR